MTRFRRLSSPLSVTVMLMVLTSCFTGIESTPRIQAPRDDKSSGGRDVRREDTYLDDIVAEPFSAWRQGKRFFVSDERFTMLLGASTPSYRLEGTTVRYAGARQTSTITGARALSLSFITSQGDTIAYRTPTLTPTDEPFLVDLDVVEKTRERLAGKQLWLETAVWRDSSDATVSGRRFIPVRIAEIEPGTVTYPIRVRFATLDGATPSEGYMFMSTGPDDGRSRRRFGSLFSLSDPHERYPSISSEIWAHVIRGEVAPGMTRDQVRLSVGSPRDVDRPNGNGSSGVYRERWFYPNGLVVVFEEGIVVDR